MGIEVRYTYTCDICGHAHFDAYEIPYPDYAIPQIARDRWQLRMVVCDRCADAILKITRHARDDLRGEMGGLHRLAAEVVADPPGKA